jgi:hypothetical protein
MNRGRSFQPNGRCGNCQSFRHTERDKAGQIIEEAHCGKDLDPKECGDEFKSRSKRIKKKKKQRKWYQEAR